MPIHPAITMTPDELDRFLDEPRTAVLGTISRDGTPSLNPVWYAWEDDRVLMSVLDTAYYAKNLLRDPRATVCVQQEQVPAKGVVIKGPVTVAHDTDYAFGRRLAVRYLGEKAGPKYAEGVAKADGPHLVVVTLVPDRVASWDHAKWR